MVLKYGFLNIEIFIAPNQEAGIKAVQRRL